MHKRQINYVSDKLGCTFCFVISQALVSAHVQQTSRAAKPQISSGAPYLEVVDIVFFSADYASLGCI